MEVNVISLCHVTQLAIKLMQKVLKIAACSSHDREVTRYVGIIIELKEL
jgi:hypothetical protein